MKVYTKTGDKGTTSLIGGQRVSKSDIHLEIYGTLDELDSFIGLLKNETIDNIYVADLEHIQKLMTKINCCYASPTAEIDSKFEFGNEEIEWIESKIDEYSATLPPITEFLIPGSNRSNAVANICRTVCRRAERYIHKMELLENQQKASVFINRLSDFFFVLGRRLE